jgi:hypothetical protein
MDRSPVKPQVLGHITSAMIGTTGSAARVP